jgi:hypothetical protein
VGALALVAFGGSAAPAQASYCSFNYEQPFYSWSDYEWYGILPGSTFETGKTPSGWTFKNKAVVKPGGNPSRPWSDRYSLSMPPKSYVITPAFCIDQYSPYSRMFAYRTPDPAYVPPAGDTSQPGGLKIDLIYTDAVTRRTVTKNLTTIYQGQTWDPTQQFPLVDSSVTPKWDTSGRASAKYQFTALPGATWTIDDVFVDPKRH